MARLHKSLVGDFYRLREKYIVICSNVVFGLGSNSLDLENNLRYEPDSGICHETRGNARLMRMGCSDLSY